MEGTGLKKKDLKRFREILLTRKKEILRNAQRTLSEDMTLESDDLPDEMDLASSEYLQSFTFRLRGREADAECRRRTVAGNRRRIVVSERRGKVAVLDAGGHRQPGKGQPGERDRYRVIDGEVARYGRFVLPGAKYCGNCRHASGSLLRERPAASAGRVYFIVEVNGQRVCVRPVGVLGCVAVQAAQKDGRDGLARAADVRE